MGDEGPASAPENVVYLYTLPHEATSASYDHAVAVSCLQGLINRTEPILYVLSSKNGRPQFWLDVFSDGERWLARKQQQEIATLDDLVVLAGDRLKGAVIWDPDVPATLNVATTMAGVLDAVVLSPAMADKYRARWNLPLLEDLRGRFDGRVSGSAKNDAYRWAIEKYLTPGRCSTRFLCLFEDAARVREQGDAKYVVTRDWSVKNRAFVYDLSPWGDEVPKDDPCQPLGTDLQTYKMMLGELLCQTAGKHMTELTGFFPFWKYSEADGFASKHSPPATEWETVYLISPYNCYHNTVSSDCFNQSLHSQAPFTALHQRDPDPIPDIAPKAYFCILMADYDSATPLYDFLPEHWNDPNRGTIPLAWGINPNLLDTYPDVIAYYYDTATENDVFTADAGAAGYINPNRIQPQHLPLFAKHNQKYFDLLDMSIAPMVLDWDPPTVPVKEAFVTFAPDGYGTIIIDFHKGTSTALSPQVYKNMPMTELINDVCHVPDNLERAERMYQAIMRRGYHAPGFYFFRIVWTSPSDVIESLTILRKQHPEIDFEVIDVYSFFSLLRQHVQ